jgi:molecular chaperone DnaJ
MNLNEAYKILQIKNDISDDELKTHYKSLARKYHPDVYRDDPNKFKLINEAYQTITDHRENPHKNNPQINSGFGFSVQDLGDLFSSQFFNGRRAKQVQHITIPVSISFVESVVGCERPLKYDRTVKCAACSGQGQKSRHNGCKSCDGFGKIKTQKGNVSFVGTCMKCYGRCETDTCKICNGEGERTENVTGTVNIAPGRHTDDTLSLRGRGNYISDNMFGENYSDVFIKITVEKDDTLELVGNDVVSHLHLTLLEALRGCTQQVKTIDGMQEVTISKMVKNKDEIQLSGLGVKNTPGTHRIILDVQYPDQDTLDKIISILEKKNGDTVKLY